MSHEAIVALEKIVTLCEKSAELPERQLRLFDIALEGLGLVNGQRQEIIRDKIQAKRDRIMARYGQAS